MLLCADELKNDDDFVLMTISVGYKNSNNNNINEKRKNKNKQKVGGTTTKKKTEAGKTFW